MGPGCDTVEARPSVHLVRGSRRLPVVVLSGQASSGPFANPREHLRRVLEVGYQPCRYGSIIPRGGVIKLSELFSRPWVSMGVRGPPASTGWMAMSRDLALDLSTTPRSEQ